MKYECDGKLFHERRDATSYADREYAKDGRRRGVHERPDLDMSEFFDRIGAETDAMGGYLHPEQWAGVAEARETEIRGLRVLVDNLNASARAQREVIASLTNERNEARDALRRDRDAGNKLYREMKATLNEKDARIATLSAELAECRVGEWEDENAGLRSRSALMETEYAKASDVEKALRADLDGTTRELEASRVAHGQALSKLRRVREAMEDK